MYCAGLIIALVLGANDSPESGLSFADLPSLLAVAVAAVGIWTLATADGEGEGGGPGTIAGGSDAARRSDAAPGTDAARGTDAASPEGPAAPVLPGLADGYIMAVALLVIGWVTLFSTEFHRSGERPGTFLLALIHPLADLAVLGALLPLATVAWQRVMLPYLAVCAILASDALAVGQRALGGAPGVVAQLLALVAALLLGAAPWQIPSRTNRTNRTNRTSRTGRTGRAAGSAATTVVAALTAAVATVVVIASGLAAGPVSGAALLVAGGAGVLVLTVRVFMLARQNGTILGFWRESSRSLRELASRTNDVVLVCDLDGIIGYASPAVGDYGYAPDELSGRRLLDYVHPEDRDAVVAACRRALGASLAQDPAWPASPANAATTAAGAAGVAGAAGSGRAVPGPSARR